MTEAPRATVTGASIWSHKPWWCQPWSILLTGVGVIALSWLWLRLWWLSALIGAAVSAWWGLFLVLVPRAWKEAQAQEKGAQ